MTWLSKWSAGRTRLLVIGAIAVLVVGVVVLALVLGTGEDEGADETAAPTAAPSTSEAAPSPEEPPAPTAAPQEVPPAGSGDEQVPALPAVALDQTVAVDEVIASIALIEAIEGTPTGPGDVGGPALRVTVRVTNQSSGDVSVDGVSVNVFHGQDRTPASPVNDPSRSPFAGVLAPAEAAEGVFVFRVPPDRRDVVTVEVGYKAGAPLATFSGPVS